MADVKSKILCGKRDVICAWNATKMRVGIMAWLWHVCLQMFSSSRHRGFGGRKGGHVICGCNYYIISQISHCAPYHMGPPNPKWWM